MSKPQSLTEWVERNLAQKDHVGSTLHFEGLGPDQVAQSVRAALKQLGARYSEEQTQTQTHAFLAELGRELYVWVAVKGGGDMALVEAKVYHQTEDSAYADELLARLSELLYKSLGLL